jgi:hypothetical protein
MGRGTIALLVGLALASGAAAADLPPGAVAKADRTADHPVLSPDGRRLAVRTGGLTVNPNSGLDLIDTATGATVSIRDRRRLAPARTWTGYVPLYAFSPDGKQLWTVNGSPDVSVWDAAAGKHVRGTRLPDPKPLGDADRHLASHAHAIYDCPAVGSVLVQAHYGALFELDARTGKLKGTYSPVYGFFTEGVSPDGRWVVRTNTAEALAGEFAVLDRKDPKGGFHGAAPGAAYPTRVRPSPDGALVAMTYSDVGGRVNGAALWRVAGSERVALAGAAGEFSGATELAFGPGGKALYCATRKAVVGWDTATGNRLGEWKLPAEGRVAFDLDRARLFLVGGGLLYKVDLGKPK